MSVSAASARPAVLRGALIAATCLTAVVVPGALGGGSPAVLLVAGLVVAAPVLAFGAAAMVWKNPLRFPALLLMGMLIFIDNPGERPGDGKWEPPLAQLASLVYDNLNKLTGVGPLRFSLLDLLIVFLVVAVVWRSVKGIALDRGTQTASCVGDLCTISLFGVLLIEGWGILRGGDFKNSLWQVRQLAYVPAMAYVFQGAFRGPADHKILGGMVVGAAVFKTFEGLYFYETVCRALNEKPDFVTTHSDSVLFVMAVVICVTYWMERRTQGSWLLFLFGVPIVMLGIMLNNRRIAYVELAAVFVMVFLVIPWTPLKRGIARLVVASLPLLIPYFVVGWNAGSSAFKPVQIAKSVISSEKDASTKTRDIENFNLYSTLKQSPILGTGFGHEYNEVSVAYDISSVFPQYRFIPHNSLLGLWAFSGVVGFTLIWLPWITAVFLAKRSYDRARRPEDRAAALCVIGAIIVYCVQAYGDMGIQSWEGSLFAAVAVAVAGKLAVAVGAWPEQAPRLKRSAA